MKTVKIASKIFHSLILLIVGAALIGVNVSKLYCNHCEVAFLQVKVMPQQEYCSCEHGCECCKTHEKKNFPCYPDIKHSFYKVTDSSQTEEFRGLNIVFCYLGKYELIVPEVLALPEHENLSEPEDFPDNPLSPESLCIYRC